MCMVCEICFGLGLRFNWIRLFAMISIDHNLQSVFISLSHQSSSDALCTLYTYTIYYISDRMPRRQAGQQRCTINTHQHLPQQQQHHQRRPYRYAISPAPARVVILYHSSAQRILFCARGTEHYKYIMDRDIFDSPADRYAKVWTSESSSFTRVSRVARVAAWDIICTFMCSA